MTPPVDEPPVTQRPAIQPAADLLRQLLKAQRETNALLASRLPSPEHSATSSYWNISAAYFALAVLVLIGGIAADSAIAISGGLMLMAIGYLASIRAQL